MIAQTARFASQVLSAGLLLSVAAVSSQAAPTTLYPQPQPSNAEQFMLERINIARANPAAEGQMLANVQDSEILRYYSHYGVDTGKLISDFAAIPARPPLAFNAKLMASSRQHSLDQAAAGFQGHDGSDGSHFDQRITGQGYTWGALGENVFAYSENAFFGHVGLNADWGVPALDHRANIMNTDPNFPCFKEVGISCVSTSIPNFGPQVITQDFGTPSDSSVSYVVGVIYNDLNGNGQYDEGEGLGGVTVTPDAGDNYAVTSASGGFVFPLPAGSGTLTVVAAGGALGAPRTKTVNYGGAQNVKVDFTTNDASGPVLPEVQITTTASDAAASAGQVGVIVIKRTGNKAADLNVALAVGGTAVNGVDYSQLPDSVTIPAGQKSVTLTVAPLSDSFTGVKNVKVKAAPGAAYTVNAAGKGKVRIIGAN